MSDPYLFGWPDELVDIHFPRGGVNNFISLPWYWYITQQTPEYFQYISPQAGGVGWQRSANLPIIKILPIDPRQLTPTSQVGFGSIEEAIDRTNAGEPISTDAWGRFRFSPTFLGTDPQYFWDVNGVKKPKFTTPRGIPTSKTDPVNIIIRDTVTSWRDDWNSLAALFNQAAGGVASDGSYTIVPPNSPFALPTPFPNIPLPELVKLQKKLYFGPLPSSVIFQTGQALFWKGAFSFNMNIAQLDATEWDMNVFPPVRASEPLSTHIASSVSNKYGGYNLAYASFPLSGLNIN